MIQLPSEGLSYDDVFSRLKAKQSDDVDWRNGRVWAYVYDAGPEAERVAKEAFTHYLSTNGLDPTSFPSLLHLENEVVGLMATHLRAPEGAVGSFTSGGTESIILSVKAARDRWIDRNPDATERPQMILPVTAHAAFHKAAHYLNVEPIVTPVSSETFRADVGAMAEAIGPRTCLLVASAPSYAHGVIDPIPAIGELALQHDLLFHVDACIGGFVLPYFRRLGADIAPFDFTVPGVTAMSVDIHKYGFAPKGASVLLHRSPETRAYQIYACATWAGYAMVNNTVQSSKSGGPLAAAWAVMHFLGDDGYLRLATRMLDATRQLTEGINAIDGLRILGDPDVNLIAFASDTLDVFKLADAMVRHGWLLHPQLAFASGPANIHLSVNPKALDNLDAFLADLRASVAALTAETTAPDPMLAMAAQTLSSIDPSQFDPSVLKQMLAMIGMNDSEGLPDDMADVNALLDAIPPKLRERLMVAFVNELYQLQPGA